MCRIACLCKSRYNIHEKMAAHSYYEQLLDFYGKPLKHPKKKLKRRWK